MSMPLRAAAILFACQAVLGCAADEDAGAEPERDTIAYGPVALGGFGPNDSYWNERYEGCFTDDDDRALPYFLGDGMSPDECFEAAMAGGYWYAGLQWYDQCWAGFEKGYERVAESNCFTECRYAPHSRCGGPWHNGIFNMP